MNAAAMQWPADKVERWPIERLIPYARNARTHSPAQVQQIAASMREWGWTNPVLVADDGTIIAGHGRVQAARSLGYDEAPVMVAVGWTEAQKRAYVIADNKLALNAGWDTEMLTVELEDLRDMSAGMLELTGMSTEELQALIGDGVTKPTLLPDLPSGEKTPFQQMAFLLHDTQHEAVAAAIARAKEIGDFTGSPNQNANANALAFICAEFMALHCTP